MEHTFAGKAAAVALLVMLGLAGSAQAQIIVHGDVYGAGKGSASNKSIALVKGNSNVDVATGTVYGNVYGGGELSSVGTYTTEGTGDAEDYTACENGKSTVTIRGGQIGKVEYDKKGVKVGGYVFGGGKGRSGHDYRLFAFVDSARVNIQTGAFVTASVFGGAENGHVFTNTYVRMTGGKVGQEISPTQRDSEDPTTGVGRWLYFGNLYGGGRGIDAIDSLPCEVSSEYVAYARLKVEGVGGVTVAEADCHFTDTGTYILYSKKPWVGTRKDSVCPGAYSLTAGRVRGNTTVHIDGGRVVRNVYGGGSLASVGMPTIDNTGIATVIINGDAVIGLADNFYEIGANVGQTFNGKGYDDDVVDWAKHNTDGEYTINTVKDSLFYRWAGRNAGNVYGSGRGEPGSGNSFYTNMAFTKKTNVTIGGNAKVRGSVFGGGENGHVRQDTYVTIQDNCFIGVPPTGSDSTAYMQADSVRRGLTLNASVKHPDPNNEHWESETGVGPTFFRGNVYGGGRGVDTVMFSITNRKHSSTAGRVYGNTNVTVTGGTIYHAVFGGGSLASVGDTVYRIKTDTSFTIPGIAGTFTSAMFDAMGYILGAAKDGDTVIFNYATRALESHGPNQPQNHRNFLRPQYTAEEISNGDGHQEYHIEDTNWVNYTRTYRVGDPIYGTGLAKVTITGGQIGVSGINDGRVYGSGRGVAGDKTTLSEMINMAYVHNSEVYIKGNADIRGAVFGGGANGHVSQNTLVRMSGGTVGVPLPLAERKVDPATGHGRRVYRGNVYGGGRGVDPISNAEHLSMTAGRVYGNTRVNISGGKVYHSVFGGGSLASVGTFNLVDLGTPGNPDITHFFTQGTGMAVVTISGSAWIGHDWKDLELYGKTPDQIKQALYDFVDATAAEEDRAARKAAIDAMNDAQRKTALIDSNYRYLGSNSGMVFGSGRGVAALENGTFNRDYAEAAFTNNTIVTVRDTLGFKPMICGSVFGGGENGHVKHNTLVTIEGGVIGGIPLHSTSFVTNAGTDESGALPITFSQNSEAITLEFLYEDAEEETGVGPTVYRGNVYGGGRGVDHMGEEAVAGFSATAGRVYGNARVNVTGGDIYHHVFGGGSIASVGTYDTVTGSEGWDAKLTGSPKKVDTIYEYVTQAIAKDHAAGAALGLNDTMHFATGNIVVTVSGGHIGRTGKNEGSVFGGGRGIAGERTKEVTHLAFANNTTVNINQGAYVTGSVFGGGANGHVLSDAHVNVSGGVVGTAFTADDTVTTRYGYSPHSVFHGNVYGGGRGVDPIDESRLSRTAGRVYGNTYVTMTGGWVRHSVYGGGSLASVGNYETYAAEERIGDSIIHKKDDIKHLRWLDVETGTLHNYDPSKAIDDAENILVETHSGRATVKILDGWIGARPTSGDGSQYHYAGGTGDLLQGQGGEGRNNGNVFGSCRGTAGKGYDSLAYVNITRVVIGKGPDDASYAGTGEPRVMGCVFGSGENGHVLDSTYVQMYSGQIGRGKKVDGWLQTFIGNLYGGGRGVDISFVDGRPSPSAGWVHNSTCVEVHGGHVWHNVFGGGSLAAVGDTNHSGYENIGAENRVGRTRVIIKGGLIGSDGDHNGNVFGSGRGRAGEQHDTIFVNVGRIVGTSSPYDLNASTLDILTGTFGSATYKAVTYPAEANLYYVTKNGTPLVIDNDFSEMTYVVNSLVTVDYTTTGDYATVKDNNRIAGSVYGSGDNGHVHHDSKVDILAGTIGTLADSPISYTENGVTTLYRVLPTSGSVYGAGRGLDLKYNKKLSQSAGRVYGNTVVNVSGGDILRNVYGGGNMSSVGTYTIDSVGGQPDRLVYIDGTGATTVNITGAPVIGYADFTLDESDANDRPEVVYGSVFGSSRGYAGPSFSNTAFVKQTTVNIGLVESDNPTIMGSVFGSGENGHVRDITNVTITAGTIGQALPSGYASLTGKAKERFNYVGNVYGGGRGVDTYIDGGNNTYSMSAGYVRGKTNVTVNGGTIHRNVYGGGSMGLVGDYGFHGEDDGWKGSGDNGQATVTILSSVGTAADRAIDASYGGNVYGSSRGKAINPADASANRADLADMAYVYKTLVNVGTADGTTALTVYGNVYGGGEAGHVDWGGTQVNILSGTVQGSVFGGGKGATTSPTAGIVDGNTKVNIGTDAQASNNVVIGEYVFGGNDAGSSPLGTMQVDIWRTAHSGANECPEIASLTDEQKANYLTESVASPAANYAIKAVYGGGNRASTLTGDKATDGGGNTSNVLNDKYITQRLNASWPVELTRLSKVIVHYCDDNTVQYVYGGGKAADTYKNDVTIEGGRVFRAFAGGDGSEEGTYSNVVTDASVRVQGGIVYEVFGGSNTRGVIGGTTSIDLTPVSPCELVNSETFGGGNEAAGNGGTIELLCGSTFHNFYGGARNANINGDIVLNVRGGVYDTIFGGNKDGGVIDGNVTVNFYGGTTKYLFGGSNAGGNITGTITVVVDADPAYSCADGLQVDYVFGGGKNASYTPDDPSISSPMVKILNVPPAPHRGIYRVFGGGLGETATVTANPYVILGDAPSVDTKDMYIAQRTEGGKQVEGEVYGGGYAAPVVGNANVTMRQGVVKGNLFGGGLGTSATISQNTVVAVFGTSEVYGNVYGGGNQGEVKGSTDIQIGYEETMLALPPTLYFDGVDRKVHISSNISGATIRYTVGDGSQAAPTPSTGTVYTDPVEPVAGQVIKAIATAPNYEPSRAAVATVPLADPAISIDPSTNMATLSYPGAGGLTPAIHYTTNGETPTYVATEYTAPFEVQQGDVVRAICILDGYTKSFISSLTVAKPEVTITGGNATFSCATPAAKLYYTVGDSPADPTTESTLYTGSPVAVAAGQTVKVIAVRPGYNNSDVVSKTRE